MNRVREGAGRENLFQEIHEMKQRLNEANTVTIQGMVLNVGLAALKFFAGWIAHSGAVIADAGHSLSDLSTDVAVLWGINAAAKPADETHPYGHGRIETMVCAGTGIFLFIVGGAIFFDGLMKIIQVLSGNVLPRPGWFAFFAATVSMVLKEWLYRKTVLVGKATGNPSLVANAWHHRSDALSSLGVMAGVFGAIILGEGWRILDPLTALVVSGFIMKVAFVVSGKSFNELMEGAMSSAQEEKILELVHSVEGVRNAHKLRTRRIGQSAAIELHICVSNELNIRQGHDIATRVEEILRAEFGWGTFVSVHVEPMEEAQE